MKCKKIILITGCELRHKFFQASLEKLPDFRTIFIIEERNNIKIQKIVSSIKKKHFLKRKESEQKFFKKYKFVKIKSKKLKLKKGEINKIKIIEKIFNKNPDLIVTFGCSILSKQFINKFNNKIINVHLGLSPYYRGTGTNFWPFVNNELQFLGATFLSIDKGVDTGPILHQFRSRVYEKDNIHKIGNRTIQDLINPLKKLILNYKNLKKIKQWKYKKFKYYKEKDFEDDSVIKLFQNYKNKIIKKYLLKKIIIDKKFKIVKSKVV